MAEIRYQLKKDDVINITMDTTGKFFSSDSQMDREFIWNWRRTNCQYIQKLQCLIIIFFIVRLVNFVTQS